MSFVREFVDYLGTRTDAPPDFHLHAALTCLSVALGNRVCCDGWTSDIYPNLWAILIAPSGYGKSAPLDMAEYLLQMADLGEQILADSFSGEALVQSLAKHPASVFIVQEFASFLAILGREYNAGLDQWLTRIYDVPAVTKRDLVKGPIEIHRPALNILAASSPDWFAQAFKLSQLRGGFLARFVFCPSTEPGAYVDDPGPRNSRVEAALADHLRQVSCLSGRADFSRVRAQFIAWDKAERKRLRADCPPEYTGMRSRAGALAKKAAMLFHVSRSTRDLVISEQDMSNAFAYVKRAHQQAERYLNEQVAYDKDDADCLRVIEILERREGRATRTTVLKDSHMSSPRLDRAQRTLAESGRLKVQTLDRAIWLTLPVGYGFAQSSQNAVNSANPL